MFEYRLHLFQGLLFTYFILDDFRLELLYHLAVFHHLLHKSRTHHFAVVGDGVIERDGRDGRNLGLVANAHPR